MASPGKCQLNLKQLFPTYRTRFRYVEARLRELCPQPADRVLNIGCGEGEYDRMIARHAVALEACDINEEDVAFARALNAEEAHIAYSVQDAHALSFPDASFDVLTCIEVIEHVDQPARLISEIARVLRPGGAAIVTCPNHDYPAVYDPLNRVGRRLGMRLPLGAYGYGHTKLVRHGDLDADLGAVGLSIVRTDRLSHGLVGAAEAYWPSAFQRVLKANSQNKTSRTRRRFVLKPTLEEPSLVALTDRIIDADERWFGGGRRSVGLGYVVRKP